MSKRRKAEKRCIVRPAMEHLEPRVMLSAATAPVPILSGNFAAGGVNGNDWHIPTWRYNGDGTYYGDTQIRTSQNAGLPQVKNGAADINVDTYNPTGFSFYGTELISNASFAEGTDGVIFGFVARLASPIPRGVVGGLFVYNTNPDGTHNEIDIELLSNSLSSIETNIYADAPLGAGSPASYPVGGSTTGFHTYQIAWFPDHVNWMVDGRVIRTVTGAGNVPQGTLFVHMNLWVPASDWAAAYDPGIQPTSDSSKDQTFTMEVASATVSRLIRVMPASTPLFDESYYLQMNPGVAAAVKAGLFASGYQHYLLYGAREGRNPSPYFDESYYLSANPGVAAAVRAGVFASGFEHFVEYGQYENRDPSIYFNTRYYLDQNPGLAAAVSSGSMDSAFLHFVVYGQKEGRAAIPFYNESYYLAHNPAIAAAVSAGGFQSGYQHFVEYGQYEDRQPSPLYDEAIYLLYNPGVATAVKASIFKDGFQHYLLYGQYEDRRAY